MGAAYDWPVWVAGKYPQGMASTINMGIPGATASIVERTVGKRVLLAEPRGYCAGVDRAVETVERMESVPDSRARRVSAIFTASALRR